MLSAPLLIDLSYFYSLIAGDKSFGNILLTGTIAEIDLLLKDFQLAWEQLDAAGIKKIAHSLVSLSAIAGMPQVSSWSRSIDQQFSDGGFHPEMGVLANQIITGWPIAKTQLETHRIIT
jgi:hypothetical protein